MEFLYIGIGIGIVIGVVGVLWIDVDMFSKKVADEEEKIDAKEEHNEGKN